MTVLRFDKPTIGKSLLAQINRGPVMMRLRYGFKIRQKGKRLFTYAGIVLTIGHFENPVTLKLGKRIVFLLMCFYPGLVYR
jgi:hypothetical protein